MPFSRLRKTCRSDSNRCNAATATSISCGRPMPITKALKTDARQSARARSRKSSTTLAGRHANDDVLRPMIREELMKHDMEYLVREGQRLGLTIGPVIPSRRPPIIRICGARRLHRDRSSNRRALRVSASRWSQMTGDAADPIARPDAGRAQRGNSRPPRLSRSRSSRGCAPPRII